MREVLFRGKTEYKSKWVEGFFYVEKGKYAGCNDIIYEHCVITTGIKESYGAYGEHTEELRERVIPETVGQYTGLADENSTKIFEGDIVKAYYRTIKKQDYAIGQVRFENGTFKIEVRGRKKDREFEKYTDADVRAYAIENNFLNRGFVLEVIGNIHDNPELLKGGAE